MCLKLAKMIQNGQINKHEALALNNRLPKYYYAKYKV